MYKKCNASQQEVHAELLSCFNIECIDWRSRCRPRRQINSDNKSP